MQEAHATGGRGVPRIDRPARLGVAVPHNDAEPVLRLLADTGFAPPGERAGDGRPSLVDLTGERDDAELAAWLEDHDDGHLLLLFNAPVPVIAAALANDVPPAEALQSWQKRAEDLLAFVRRHRRRLSLMPLEPSLADPKAFSDLLGQRLGLHLRTPAHGRNRTEPAGALYRMMAENAVWQSPVARHTAAELEASALPMPPVAALTLPAVEEVYREFSRTVERAHERKEQYKAELEKVRHRLQDHQQQSGRVEELEEHNELLLQQLHQAQEELENAFRETRELRKQLDDAAAEPKTDPETEKRLAQEKDAAEEQARELQEENELLLMQLHQVQEELESYFLSEQEVRKQLERANETIQALYNSKSWKITKPLRVVLDLLTGGPK
jgi:hypothetical protein